MNPRTTLLPALTALVGVAVVVRTATDGSVLGVVLGLLMIAAGAGRLYIERRGP